MAEGKGIVSVDALDHIAVCRFATARAQEIVALTNMIGKKIKHFKFTFV